MAQASTDRLEALEAEHQALGEQYCAMEEHLGEFLEKIEQLEEKIKQLEESNEEQEETIKEQEEELEQEDRLLGLSMHKIQQQKERILSLQAQLKREEAYNYSLIKKQLDGEELHSDEMIQGLARVRYHEMIEELESATLREEEAIDQLFEQIPGITQDVIYRETDYYLSGLEQSTKYVADLKAEKDALAVENADLKTAKHELEVENVDLKTAKDELETEFARLQIANAEHENSAASPVFSPDAMVQVLDRGAETTGGAKVQHSGRKKRSAKQDGTYRGSDHINVGIYIWNVGSGSYGKVMVIPVATAAIPDFDSLTRAVRAIMAAAGFLGLNNVSTAWLCNTYGEWRQTKPASGVDLLAALAKIGGHAEANESSNFAVSYLLFPDGAGKKAQVYPAA
ncbi:uncharacterized protein AB675_9413 [Cyphellophora attinorum]|uniref:Uncharacterized protein n=1 Tax=Cyphellophora attinorum TaxID=1664694 RepID=A0A0N0NNI5_9EURO|nr:uncharacterized protein AB675_9413 [Phialophora attinorum]KPI41568.1 hypothetical protein AB675_9413 [Phialophora attinorum]